MAFEAGFGCMGGVRGIRQILVSDVYFEKEIEQQDRLIIACWEIFSCFKRFVQAGHKMLLEAQISLQRSMEPL